MFKRIALVLFTVVPSLVRAQDGNDMVNFLQAGSNDASKLTQAYLNPVIEGLSYGFNGGWFSTAKAHKSFGFDFGVSANAVFIPSSKNYFDPNKLNLETATLSYTEAPNGKAPTIVGPSYETTYTGSVSVDTDGDGTPDETRGYEFDGPQGLDFEEAIKISGVLAPTAQLGIGIYKNTDLKIRWMPEVEVGSSKIKLFGLGVMHDIKQHIPGLKLLMFDLSVLAAYTKIQGETGMEGAFAPEAGDTRPQKLNYEMNAWLMEAIISKKLSFVTFYGGVGYNAVKSTADVTGSYDIFDDGTLILNNPVSLDFKNNSFRLTGGMRLKMAIFYLSADYTLQEYSTVSVGFGVSVK